MGLENATKAAVRVLPHQPFCLAISTGFACGLIAMDVGALLAGYEVALARRQDLDVSPMSVVPGIERDVVVNLVERVEPSGHIGRFVSTEYVITSAAEKHRFAQATSAIGLDMESAALAAEAWCAQVPFVVVRAVSDLVDEDLPLDFNLFLRPTGWMKGVATIVGRLSSITELCRLHRQSRVAAQTLTMFFRRYTAEMLAADTGVNSSMDRRS